MSTFVCEHCGTVIEDSPRGYTTRCNHYPHADVPDVTAEEALLALQAQAQKLGLYRDDDNMCRVMRGEVAL